MDLAGILLNTCYCSQSNINHRNGPELYSNRFEDLSCHYHCYKSYRKSIPYATRKIYYNGIVGRKVNEYWVSQKQRAKQPLSEEVSFCFTYHVPRIDW